MVVPATPEDDSLLCSILTLLERALRADSAAEQRRDRCVCLLCRMPVCVSVTVPGLTIAISIQSHIQFILFLSILFLFILYPVFACAPSSCLAAAFPRVSPAHAHASRVSLSYVAPSTLLFPYGMWATLPVIAM